MNQQACAACGKPAGDANLCKECVKDWAKRLAWLLKAGMPALQQIAYKQATTRERSPRHGNAAYAAPPVNEAAQALYSTVETHLQLTGGMLGVKPIGHDQYGHPRTLMQWADITSLLLHHMHDLARLDTGRRPIRRPDPTVGKGRNRRQRGPTSAVLSAYAPTA